VFLYFFIFSFLKLFLFLLVGFLWLFLFYFEFYYKIRNYWYTYNVSVGLLVFYLILVVILFFVEEDLTIELPPHFVLIKYYLEYLLHSIETGCWFESFDMWDEEETMFYTIYINGKELTLKFSLKEEQICWYHFFIFIGIVLFIFFYYSFLLYLKSFPLNY